MRDGYGSAEYAALYGGKEMSLAQLHGSYVWHEVGLVGVPQGWAGPKEAEELHARLNDVPEMQHWPGGNDMARDLHAAVTQRTRVSARFLPALPSYGAVTAAQGGIVSLWAVLAAVWAVKLPTRPRQARLSPGRSQIGSSPARAFSRFA